ncbi:transcription initiation factor IIF subunit alpha-like [Venturia canescens]|uniref:transcription initiation factor IIF subunit alpha-like n=1 Tax=Venturia canescens TaxID=32260 RepID=UPI001C9BEA82|nr:transcription initiation factor IIF subunit alpha-like [Venturia canescens]
MEKMSTNDENINIVDGQPKSANIHELVVNKNKEYVIEYIDREGCNGITARANEIFLQDAKSKKISRGTDETIEKYFRNPMNQHSLRIRQPNESNQEKGGYERIRVIKCLDSQENENENGNTFERARRIPKKKPLEESPVIKYSPALISVNEKTTRNNDEELSRSGLRKKCLQKDNTRKTLKKTSILTQKQLTYDFTEILPINKENRQALKLQRHSVHDERSQDDESMEEEPLAPRKWKKILRIASSSDDDDDSNDDNNTNETNIPIYCEKKADDIVNGREGRETSMEDQIFNEANRDLNHLNEKVLSIHDDGHALKKHNSIPVDETPFEYDKVQKTRLTFAVESQKAIEDNDNPNDGNGYYKAMREKEILMEKLDDVHVVASTNEVQNIIGGRIHVELKEYTELTNANMRVTDKSAGETAVRDECDNIENDIETQLQRIHEDVSTVAPIKKPTVTETRILRKGESVLMMSQRQYATTNSCMANEKVAVKAYETPIRKGGPRRFKLEFPMDPSRNSVGTDCNVNQNKDKSLRREAREITTWCNESSSGEEQTESNRNVITSVQQVIQTMGSNKQMSEERTNKNCRLPRDKKTKTKAKLKNKECDGKRYLGKKEEEDLYDLIDDDRETQNASISYDKTTIVKEIVPKVASMEKKRVTDGNREYTKDNYRQKGKIEYKKVYK